MSIEYIGPDRKKVDVIQMPRLYTEEQIRKILLNAVRLREKVYQMPSGEILPIKPDLTEERQVKEQIVEEIIQNLRNSS